MSRKPDWPEEKQLDRLRNQGLQLSHFVLEPGDFVHINKGRLHAFRKLEHGEEPVSSHAFAASKLKPLEGAAAAAAASPPAAAAAAAALAHPNRRVEAGLCVSVAWDWQFEGVSCQGVAAEARHVL